MNKIRHAIICAAVILLTGFSLTAQAQPQRASHQQVKFLIDRIEEGAGNFRASLKDALDKSRFNDTRWENNINQFVGELENAADRLKNRFGEENTAVKAVEEVLQRASVIEGFMRTHWLSPYVQTDWDYLRQNLDSLARVYDVSWNWFGLSREPFRVSQQNMKALLARIEDKGDRFRKSLDQSLDRTRFDGTRAEDNINQFAKDIEVTTDLLMKQFDNQHAAVGTVGEVLRRAVRIDNFMRRHRLTPLAQEAWTSLRQDLDQLARAYDVSMNWRGAAIIL